MTKEEILKRIRLVVELHFQECEAEGIYGKSKYLADTDHETISDLMEEFEELFSE